MAKWVESVHSDCERFRVQSPGQIYNIVKDIKKEAIASLVSIHHLGLEQGWLAQCQFLK